MKTGAQENKLYQNYSIKKFKQICIQNKTQTKKPFGNGAQNWREKAFYTDMIYYTE